MDHIDNIISNRERAQRRQEFNEQKALNEAKLADAEKRRSIVEYHDTVNNAAKLTSELSKFYDKCYKSLITETFTGLAIESAVTMGPTDKAKKRAVMESLMKAYFEDRSVAEMKRTFAASSQFLAEVNLICDKYATIISEKAKEKCKDKKCSEINPEDIFKIEQPDRDNFYKDIDAVNADELSYTIRNRVMDATQTFIDDYNRNKVELKAVLKDTNDTINFLKEGSNLAQYYTDKAKRRMKDITDKSITSVYESMVLGFSKSVYNNKELSNVFITEDANLDTDSVREHCEVMYTVLETLNTAKVLNKPEEFLAKQMHDISNI